MSKLDLRKDFEGIEEIKGILHKGLFEYNDKLNSYSFIDPLMCIGAKPSDRRDSGYINGAWFIFQELNK